MSLSERIENACPVYMAMGMTYEQFWDGEPSMLKAVRKAHTLRQDIKNQDAWLQGMYIYEAIADLVPVLRFSTKKEKAVPYRDKPYEFQKPKKKKPSPAKTETNEHKREDDIFNAYMTAWMSSVNKKYDDKNNGKEVVDDAGRKNK